MNTLPSSTLPPVAVTPPESDNGDRSLLRIGLVVLFLGVLLVGAIVVGVLTTRDGSDDAAARVTVADLRADPDRYDNHSVTLQGRVEDVRQLPYLDQYAVYTFRDDTGSMLALTRKGVPPDDQRDDVVIDARYHSRVTLDDELKAIVEDQLGPLAGRVVGFLLPGVPLNVVFLEHERYATPSP